MALLLAAALPASASADNLHVPSPDWRDQVIYFALTDRFDDGDPSNNDQGAGEFDPADKAKYHGGDFAGLLRRLDYIKGLGATALWVTPPVRSQWWDPVVKYGGYHGYWAQDFGQVDPHLGTLADYQRLSRALHAAGMYLVQDIVVNHTGNFFSIDAGGRHALHAGAAPGPAPFHLNDPRDPAARRAGIYHWTPDIRDFRDPRQLLTYQLAGLDDLDTENARVRHALRKVYGDWIRDAGVDAFRIDTAFYVPPAYFRDFLHARDPAAPGIARVAASLGKPGFHAFGEGFGIDRPFEDREARRIERYMRDREGPLLPGMLNFPLYGALQDSFARGQPPAVLGNRIARMMRVHRRVHWMPTFVDNHDVDRFLSAGSEAALRQALLAIMTLPGIPVVYYGTEQGFTRPREAMFRDPSGAARDAFDATSPGYRFLREAIALRRGDRLFSRGTPTILAAHAAGPGVLAWRMAHGGRAAIVMFNTADRETLAANVATGLAPGTVLRGRFGLDGMPVDIVVGRAGRVTLPLPARAGMVWDVTTARESHPVPVAPTPTLSRLGSRVAGDTLALAGRAAPGATLALVVDGDLAGATGVTAGADGRWRARLDTSHLAEGAVRHAVVAWDGSRGSASAAMSFSVSRRWTLLADVPDPAHDDAGPGGHYRYPDDPVWRGAHPADIRRVRAWSAGGALKVEVTLASLSRVWNPVNGFDHVALTLFLELPGEPPGSTVMPQQDGHLPAGMRWQRRLRVHGWSNALFDAAGADASREGGIVAPAPTIAVDVPRRRVTLTFAPGSLPAGAGWTGARLYLNTWDYDGGYRPLAATASGNAFGGGVPGQPKVMDAAGPILLAPPPR